ncbi:hypothetical protein DWUX_1523 [Desulfovibrio diazotrophicus]|nr:hypothetical protein DWUX_1523 [Desulfovibrio diazotrophicus]
MHAPGAANGNARSSAKIFCAPPRRPLENYKSGIMFQHIHIQEVCHG